MSFQELVQLHPLMSIIIFSFIITWFITVLYKKFSNQEGIKNARLRAKELQEKLKNEKDQTKLIQLQKEMLEISMEQMKYSMKPMLITFVPIILAFSALRHLYAGVGNIIDWNIHIPILCSIFKGLCDGAGWFLSYIFLSLGFSVIIRKIMKVH